MRPKRHQIYFIKGRRDFNNKKEVNCSTRKKEPIVMKNYFHINAAMKLTYVFFENIKITEDTQPI